MGFLINPYVFAVTGGPGAAPALFATGGYDATAGAGLFAAYPASVAANDIAFIQVHVQLASGTAYINTPAGWTEAANTNIDGTALARQALFWKRLDGTETGSVEIDLSNNANATCQTQMSVWRGCVTAGTPYENLSTNEGSPSSSMTGADVTTTGPNRRVIYFGAHGQTATCSPAVGWDEIYDNETTVGIPDGALHTYAIERASAGTLSGVAHTLSASRYWDVISLALIPA